MCGKYSNPKEQCVQSNEALITQTGALTGQPPHEAEPPSQNPQSRTQSLNVHRKPALFFSRQPVRHEATGMGKEGRPSGSVARQGSGALHTHMHTHKKEDGVRC